MLALMSSAWVLPSLAGPAVAGFVADHASWRWVFVFLLPFLPLAMALTLPGLRALPAPGASPAPRRLAAALALAAGTGVFLAALELEGTALLVLLAAAGLAIAIPALRTLLPAGTLRAARGLPSGVAVRGLLAVGFLGCDAFMPLALTELRGFSSSQAGLVISAASLSWSLGAYLQARRDRADDGAGRPQRARVGLAVLLAGIAIGGAGVLDAGVPIAVAIGGWMVAGLGIGIGYSSIGALVLSQAGGGEEGVVSAALQLSETISVAIFTGVGGALIALGIDRGWDAATALALVFAAGAATAVAGLVAGRRVAPRSSRRSPRSRRRRRTATTSPVSTSASTRTQVGAGRRGRAAARAPAGAARVPSTSRAASSPPAGTSRSRGPAARKSGTSKPPERRTSDGTPVSSSRPCSSSASGWFCAVATRTSSPSA